MLDWRSLCIYVCDGAMGLCARCVAYISLHEFYVDAEQIVHYVFWDIK